LLSLCCYTKSKRWIFLFISFSLETPKQFQHLVNFILLFILSFCLYVCLPFAGTGWRPNKETLLIILCMSREREKRDVMSSCWSRL
jgi:hypothetical protein